MNIIINGQQFVVNEIDVYTAQHVRNNKGKMFYGINWSMFEVNPRFDTISTVEIEGVNYNAKEFPMSATAYEDNVRYLWWNGSWWKLTRMSAPKLPATDTSA